MSSAGPESKGSAGQALPVEGLAHLGAVYLIWSSTYLAIRVTVRPGGGFPPFTMGATRLLLAGLLLLGIALLRRRKILPSAYDLATMAASGILLWGVANGLVVWAEQRADSGLAALIIGSVPIWAAVLDSLLDRRLPNARLFAALLLGFLGLGALAWPVLRSGVQADVISVATLMVAAFAWASGSVLQRRRKIGASLLVSSAYQHLAGGIWLAALVFLLDEPLAAPSTAAWAAWIYLVVFGGLAFTSFVQALKLLPISVTMTYAYVNPVIAVFLGWLILSESVTGWTVVGAALVLLGVAGVFHERYGRSKVPAHPPTPRGERASPEA